MMIRPLLLSAFAIAFTSSTSAFAASSAYLSFTNKELSAAGCASPKTPILFEGESLSVSAGAAGMDTKGAKFVYTWSTDGFRSSTDGNTAESDSSTYTFKVPPLAANTDASTLIFGVRVVSKTGEEATAFKPLRVWRPYYLKLDPSKQKCAVTLPAEQMSGVYTNGTSVSRTITIEDSNADTSASESGWKKGFSFSVFPSFLGFGLFGFGWDQSYMASKGRSVETRNTTKISTEILPEEAAVFFRQLTLLKNHYNIIAVDRCAVETSAGHAFYNNWVSAYPVTLVDAKATDPLQGISVGVPASDNCTGFEEELSGDASSVGTFFPTN
jgi:hypothetical protein